ncbi:proto-oncogene serine/threonine-protein kinase mos [Python bivittatus]|uniref:non-specific serine/threonine protein kinase n=1 Tax=Python bivittatus TaxID=176946 RepID=A0A9F2W8A5_PYTBI|nr:proto-oncogene serine/threonine-protein kinase mos [Python bivittatus]
MPSPLPLNRLLHLEFSPSVDARPCSSPLVCPAKGEKFFGGESVSRIRRLPPHLAWCSIDWDQLCLLHLLGSGGFGSVYKATYHGATVAVKQVKRCSKNHLASRQSFWAELNVARLGHNNVVRIVAASACTPASQDSLGTIIMEYVGNCTLHHAIYGTGYFTGLKNDGLKCDHGFLSTAQAVGYSCDIAAGLMFLHSQLIVHLDLKPANVFITERNVCKIGDFGCSQKLEDTESSGLQFCHQGGTYTHRAPELLKGEKITPKADIYSFAITLWQMVTQQEPYLGERQYILYSVVAYHLRPSLTAAVFKGSATGQQLKTIIESCWRANGAERPSAQGLLYNLRALSVIV